MIALLQRVGRARVTVAGEAVGEIGPGLLVLLGVVRGDQREDAAWLARKTAELRIFEDGAGRMNLSVEETGGGVLVVSQFTLAADCRKGRRPAFTGAAPPEEAEALYRAFRDDLAARGLPTATGRFGAMMQVELVNDGPVTVILNSRERG